VERQHRAVEKLELMKRGVHVEGSAADRRSLPRAVDVRDVDESHELGQHFGERRGCRQRDVDVAV